jgi:hypothetical protein
MSEPTQEPRPGDYPLGGHETRDVRFGPIVWSAIAALVLISAILFGLRFLFDYYAGREAELSPPENPLAAEYGRRLPPEPRLQPAPVLDLRALRADERARLDTYGWVDRKAGVVRIPIDRAIDILARRGLPGGKGPEGKR